MRKYVPLLALSSLLVTVFLFYIDEGNYHLNGILKLANLVPLGIYFLGIFGCKLILLRLIWPRSTRSVALISAIMFGSIAGTLLSAGFFLSLSALRTIG